MQDQDLYDFALRCAKAPVIERVPLPVDVATSAPLNPPTSLQTKFVGLSFESAFIEAYTFVSVVRTKVAACGLRPIDGAERIVDFGAGWGRISRMLLHFVPPTSLYAVDVDPEMTALVNTTMPGINSLTVRTLPPTALASDAFDGVLAFSVFSHLSEAAHSAWATEFGRLVRPGGFAAITVLDDTFFNTVREAQKQMAESSPSHFARNLSTTFPDVAAAEAAYTDGVFQYANVGPDGAREEEHYGWAVAPSAFVKPTWARAGFLVREWVPANVLFPQALVILEKLEAKKGKEGKENPDPPGLEETRTVMRRMRERFQKPPSV